MEPRGDRDRYPDLETGFKHAILAYHRTPPNLNPRRSCICCTTWAATCAATHSGAWKAAGDQHQDPRPNFTGVRTIRTKRPYRPSPPSRIDLNTHQEPMKLADKIRWTTAIVLVFFIVLGTNLIDRDYFYRLSDTVTTLYEDRLVASDLLFDMSRIIKDKEIALLTSDTLFLERQNTRSDQELDGLLARYRLTKLTDQEQLSFAQLEEQLELLRQQESAATSTSRSAALKTIKTIDDLLHNLSKIQLQEGKRQFHIGNKAKDRINFLTQGEIIFLIIMAILVQVIILYKPKTYQEK